VERQKVILLPAHRKIKLSIGQLHQSARLREVWRRDIESTPGPTVPLIGRTSDQPQSRGVAQGTGRQGGEPSLVTQLTLHVRNTKVAHPRARIRAH
jgi:hypothetical protein